MSEGIKLILISFNKTLKAIFHNWHIKKVLNFSNFFKILFLYIFALLWVMIFDIDYSKNFWNHLLTGKISEKRFSFYSVMGRIGEEVVYDRMLKVADKQGYDYSAFKFSEALSYFSITAHFYYVSTSIINYLFKPRFNLALTHHVNILPKGYNLVYLNMPLSVFFNVYGKFNTEWEHLANYDAYVDLYSLVHGKNELLTNLLENTGQAKPIIPMYLAQGRTNYSELSMNQALITGSLWGCNRGSLRMLMALKKLADEDLLIGIGVKKYLSFLGKAYLGQMESFEAAVDALQNLQKKYGIALIIHSQDHMLDGIPTSRILEAASSGAVIISDQNQFLLKFFGDSVLYFDAFASSDQIYATIKEHILWAKNNQDQARIKTQKAYQIFIDHFTLEKQLEELHRLVLL